MLGVNRRCCLIMKSAKKKDQEVGHLPYQFEMVMKSEWERDEILGGKDVTARGRMGCSRW